MAAPEFIVVGHVTLDRFAGVTRPGGSALYAAIAAQRLGLSVGILTSHGDDFPLDGVPPQIEVVAVAAPRTTAFEHEVRDDGRRLRVQAAARPIGADDVPEDWRDAELVLLAPVIAEVDVGVAAAFADATLAASAQGWLRGVGPGGAVVPQPWTPPPSLLGRLQALFVSTDDVRGHEALITEWVQRMPLVAVTAGSKGALLYVSGERYEVPPRASREVDGTGAGDVFAAVFMIRYHLDGDPWRAAAAASVAAGLTVEGDGVAAIPDRAGLDAALTAYDAAHEGAP